MAIIKIGVELNKCNKSILFRTPFHADVFASYSWSVNLIGQKRWIFIPPDEEIKLLDSLGNLPYDIDGLKHKVEHYELIQNPGDAIFVPSGWHHQVWNLKDTISINHNWFNGCNINDIWCALNDHLQKVKHEISDCKNSETFIEQTQILLNASFGMNFSKFFEILKFIAFKRINRLKNSIDEQLKKHDLFDLLCIKLVLQQCIKSHDVLELNQLKLFKVEPIELLNSVQEII